MANLGQMLVSDLPMVAMHMPDRPAAGTARPQLGAAMSLCRWARPPGHAGLAALASCDRNCNNNVASIMASRPRAT